MKNIILLLLFPFLGFGQSPSNIPKSKERLNKKQKKVASKMFFPNPTYGDIEFDLNVIGHDHLVVSINNILAKELWSQTVNRTNFKVDVGFLAKGTYLLCIKKMDGEVLTTRRLAIITP